MARDHRRRRGAARPPYVGDVERTVAELAVATGIAPQLIAELEPDAFAALAHAAHQHATRWSHTEELLAGLLELLAALRREWLVAHGAKGRDVPQPFHYPRPYEPPPAKPPPATRAEIAAKFPRR